jgi:hypothetical protein
MNVSKWINYLKCVLKWPRYYYDIWLNIIFWKKSHQMQKIPNIQKKKNIGIYCLNMVTSDYFVFMQWLWCFFSFKKCRWTIWHWIIFSIALMNFFANSFILWHTCREKAHYMERMVICLYVHNFITSWSLHDLRGPSLCCQCNGYWLNAEDSGFECH